MLDVFNATDAAAFSVRELTDAINRPLFKPQRLEAMGLFRTQSIAVTNIAIEEKDNILTLVSPSPRGAPGETMDNAKRKLRPFVVPHFQLNRGVYADEVQGVRAWGTDSSLEVLQEKVSERMMEMRDSLEVTLEHARMGAVIGVITYADSSTLDLFAEFEVSQDAEIDFDLDNANPAAGALRKKCAGITRQMSKNLGGLPFTGIHALCGDAFFDDLLAHVEVRNTFLNNPAAAQLRAAYIQNGQSFGSFDFGGITFENYRGYVGATDFINTDKCHLFPLGVNGLFRSYFAPGDFKETVNRPGQRLYMKQWDMENGKGINLEVQMNVLSLCTRPLALLKGKRT